jgi:hypothetical protein
MKIRTLQARQVQSIDVGCFQINLLHHPKAFTSIGEALDPSSNARYAGQFLTSLYARTGNWSDAVASYHSAQPERGNAYRARVFADWTTKGRTESATGQQKSAADPITAISTFLPRVRVWRPGDAGTAAGLPHVMVPSGTAVDLRRSRR